MPRPERSRPVYVRFAGGLGNQLFQLAAAAILAQASGGIVVPVVSALQRYSARRRFEAFDAVRCPTIPMRTPSQPDSFFLDSCIARARIGRWLPITGVNDRNFWRRIDAARRNDGPFVLDGYFQDGWTAPRIETLRGSLQLNPELPPPSKSAPCMVHIRGGDFLKHPLHHVATAAYYAAAAGAAAREGHREFLVITDDASYAQRQIVPALVAGSGGIATVSPPAPEPLVDFSSLLHAPARIIGNSTFAWWAAALDPQKACTWSPAQLLRGRERTSVLAWERIVHVQ